MSQAPAVTITGPLRDHLTGCEFAAAALASHPDLSAGARWALSDLATKLQAAVGMLATVDAKLAADAGEGR